MVMRPCFQEVIDPAADNTIYFPNASGLAVLSSGVAPEAAKSFIGIDNGLGVKAPADDYEISLDVADPMLMLFIDCLRLRRELTG